MIWCRSRVESLSANASLVRAAGTIGAPSSSPLPGLLVSEPLKGSADGFVNVVTVGGTLDGITQTVSGMPVFEPEEEALLFLEPSKNGQWQPLGMSQGKFRILRNRQTGEQEVVHSLSGLELYDPASRSLSQQEKPSRAPLKPMVERIRRMVRN